jgi:TetR/AcrR family transcriptional regulator, regulator of autoinduction and epiphytic fitness
MLKAREDALVASVNRLLCEKGYEAMTIDEVAADAGIAKASLYKHFESKEELAAAAMIRVIDRAIELCARLQQDATLGAYEKLHAAARWGAEEQIAGRMPALPSQNSALRAALASHAAYIDRLVDLSERLGEWIEAAQREGRVDPELPAIVVLYTLFARGCDPVLTQLKAGGEFDDAQIVEWSLRACFAGLDGPAKPDANRTAAKRPAPRTVSRRSG